MKRYRCQSHSGFQHKAKDINAVKCVLKAQKVMHAIITCKVSSIHGQVPARGAGIATTLPPIVCSMGGKGCLCQTPTTLRGSCESSCHQSLTPWHVKPGYVTDHTLILLWQKTGAVSWICKAWHLTTVASLCELRQGSAQLGYVSSTIG